MREQAENIARLFFSPHDPAEWKRYDELAVRIVRAMDRSRSEEAERRQAAEADRDAWMAACRTVGEALVQANVDRDRWRNRAAELEDVLRSFPRWEIELDNPAPGVSTRAAFWFEFDEYFSWQARLKEVLRAS